MRAGWWAGIDDVEGIRKLLLDAVNRGDTLMQEFRPDTERIAQYERAVLARRYAQSAAHDRRPAAGKRDETSPDARAGPPGMLKIAVVSRYFPSSGEPWQGRSAYQTIRALNSQANVHVFYPNSAYPSFLRPRTRLYKGLDSNYSPAGVSVSYHDYPALPLLSRPFNGAIAARALLATRARLPSRSHLQRLPLSRLIRRAADCQETGRAARCDGHRFRHP